MNSSRVLRGMVLQECGLPARKRPGWPLSQVLAKGGTHPGPRQADHPSEEGIGKVGATGRSPLPARKRSRWPLSQVLARGGFLFASSLRCWPSPRSVPDAPWRRSRSTKPCRPPAWRCPVLEGAQRSLDDANADYADSLETASTGRPVAAYGATHNAYQRWVTDEVRELPEEAPTLTLGGGDT